MRCQDWKRPHRISRTRARKWRCWTQLTSLRLPALLRIWHLSSPPTPAMWKIAKCRGEVVGQIQIRTSETEKGAGKKIITTKPPRRTRRLTSQSQQMHRPNPSDRSAAQSAGLTARYQVAADVRRLQFH